ncbi:hypothetical protein [Streptomyces sp. NPDC007088]
MILSIRTLSEPVMMTIVEQPKVRACVRAYCTAALPWIFDHDAEFGRAG